MNILFLTLIEFSSYNERNIYTDLLREFIRHDHNVYSISPTEKRNSPDTHWEEEGHILKLKTGNIQKTNIIEKGISTIRIEGQFVKAIRQYFTNIKFDLILYSTPPITLVKAVEYIKSRDNARTYLLLKDIFPQNAVDLGMMGTTGIKGLLYKYFRDKEKKLYAVSDRIGCMSPANVKYVLEHNPEEPADKVEVCPNSIEVQDMRLTEDAKAAMRQKYNIPMDKTVFVYGGNLGKPQGIPFMIDCLRTQEAKQDVFFLIVGDGTEYHLIEEYVNIAKPPNVKLMQRLPKDDYDRMIAACDVGMIFLDHRFTIPNFPSRLLSYMQAGLPVLACTDSNTDVGKVIEDSGFGWWCESDDTDKFDEMIMQDHYHIKQKAGNSIAFLNSYYATEKTYEIIMGRLE